jgi:Protein of unknown function (DUF4242)
MPSYVVELYQPAPDTASVQRAADRLASRAGELSAEGTHVRYLDTIFLPSDETCLHLFEAGSEADVRAVAKRAGIDVDRIAPAEQIRPSAIGSNRQQPEQRGSHELGNAASPPAPA